MEPFLVPLLLAFLSEVVDKTQLVILGFAMRYKTPFVVFLGALSAHAVMDGVAILFGTSVSYIFMSEVVKALVGVLFLAVGASMFAKLTAKEHERKEESKKLKVKSIFVTTFLTILISEFGDKTQIVSGLLAARYIAPLLVFLGVLLALALAIGLNVFIGSQFAKRLPVGLMKRATAILFVVFGAVTLAS